MFIWLMLCSLGFLESRLWENLPYSSLVASLDFPGGSDGKESACNSGDLDSIPRLGRSPGEVNGTVHSSILAWRIPWGFLAQVPFQRNLEGCGPWDGKELDTTEQLIHILFFLPLASHFVVRIILIKLRLLICLLQTVEWLIHLEVGLPPSWLHSSLHDFSFWEEDLVLV